jgi:ubiquinone/menaquinone biosynthesis C-methylase UbiE
VNVKRPADHPPSLTQTFDWLADRYEQQTSWVSWGGYHRWLAQVVTVLERYQPTRVVDLGAGTGALLRQALARHPEWQVLGVDQSSGMLQQMPNQIARENLSIEAWAAANPSSCDAAVMTFVLRDQPDPVRTLKAARHALKPKGQLVILETHTPEGWRALGFRWYFHGWLPKWGAWMLTPDWPYPNAQAPYRWLSESHRGWDRAPFLPQWLAEAGFHHLTEHSRPSDVVLLWSAERSEG